MIALVVHSNPSSRLRFLGSGPETVNIVNGMNLSLDSLPTEAIFDGPVVPPMPRITR